ncbi:hypothetical protein ATCC90586_009788 [Pythium insidiosum]|nr:hypothetical protein ATCC90586_009788 [Pythium insidiosum]
MTATTSRKRKRSSQQPAHSHGRTNVKHPGSLSTGQIEAFADFVGLHPDERTLRSRVFEDLKRLLSKAFPGAVVELYGSSSSRLETFRSDLDVTVGNLRLDPAALAAILQSDGSLDDEDDDEDLGEDGADEELPVRPVEQEQEPSEDEEPTFSLNLSLPSAGSQSHARPGQRPRAAASAPTKSPWNPTLRRDKLRKLRAIQQVLRCRLPSFQVKCLPKARIPILMALDPVSGLNVDIGINRETLEASDHGRTTALVTDLQASFGRPFTAVVAFLKEFLHQFDLDKPFTGGLGSYRLYMMVAFILTRGAKGKTARCGSVLLEFFGLYGNRAKPGFLSDTTQLTVHHGRHMDVVDFASIFRLQDCIDQFAMAYDILKKHHA